MSEAKEPITVAVGRELLEMADEAAVAGRASSVSSWVNAALAERAAKELHLHAMADALAVYEAEFGEISPGELIAQQHEDEPLAQAARRHVDHIRG